MTSHAARRFATVIAIAFASLGAAPLPAANADSAVLVQISAPDFAGVPIDGSYGALDLQVQVVSFPIGTVGVELDQITLGLAPTQAGSPWNTSIDLEIENNGTWSTAVRGITSTATIPVIDPATGKPPTFTSLNGLSGTIHLRARLS